MAHGEGRLGADPVLAMQWLRRAADFGHPKAMRLVDRLRNTARHYSVGAGDGDEEGCRPPRLAESAFSSSNALDPDSSRVDEDGAAEGRRPHAMSDDKEDELADLADAFHEEEDEDDDDDDDDAQNEESRVKFAAVKHLSSRLSFTSGLDALNSKKGASGEDDNASHGSSSEDEFDQVVEYDDEDGGDNKGSSSASTNGEDGKPPFAPGGASLNKFRAVRASLRLDNRGSLTSGGDNAPGPVGHKRRGSSVEWSSSPLANRGRASTALAAAASATAAVVRPGINPVSAEASRALQQLEDARASLAVASESLAQATRRGQRQFDALASFEAERRDAVDRRLLGPNGDLAKLLGSTTALSDLHGSSSSSSSSGGGVAGLNGAGFTSRGSIGGSGVGISSGVGGGSGHRCAGRGLLALVGATARYGTALPVLVETLQVAEASDMRAAERLEALADMWQKAATHAHKEHHRLESNAQESELTGSNADSPTAPAGVATPAVSSFTASLRTCLAELARGMAQECRKSAEQHAALALSADTARCGLSQRASELRSSIETAAQEVKRRNQGVRMAWSQVAEAHKQQARRRHAAAQILKRSGLASRAVAAAASGSADNVSELLQAATSVAEAEHAAAAAAEGAEALASSDSGSSGSGVGIECRWLALDTYRRHVRCARTSAEAAARSFAAAEDLCVSLPSACAALEGDVLRRALKARARLLRRCGFLCNRVVHAHLLSPSSSPAAAPPQANLASSDAATSPSPSSSSTASEAALLAWRTAEWSPERRSHEAGGVAAALRAFIDGAVLERRSGRVLIMAGLDAVQTALGSSSSNVSSNSRTSKNSSVLVASQQAASSAGPSSSPSRGPPERTQNRRQSGYSSSTGSGAAAVTTMQARDTYSRAAAAGGEQLVTWVENIQKAEHALNLASGKISEPTATNSSFKLLKLATSSLKQNAATTNGLGVSSSILELGSLERALVAAASAFDEEASNLYGANALLPAAAVATLTQAASKDQAAMKTRTMPGDRALGVALSGASTAALDAAACLALSPVPAPAPGQVSKSDLAALMAGGQITATSDANTSGEASSTASSGHGTSGVLTTSPPPTNPPSASALALMATAALAPPLKRASACMLRVQRRGMPPLTPEDENSSQMFQAAALVLTADGKLHAFLDPLPPSGSLGASSAAAQVSESSGSNGSSSIVNLPDVSCFTRAMDLKDRAGGVSPQLPFFTVPLSAAPNGRRTAVAKAKPGVFRVLITDGVESSSGNGPEGGAAATEGGGAGAANVEDVDEDIEGGSVVLPPSLLWSTPSQPDPLVGSGGAPPIADTTVADCPIEAILVDVGSDEDADGATIFESQLDLFMSTSLLEC